MLVHEYRCERCGIIEISQNPTGHPPSRCPHCEGEISEVASNSSWNIPILIVIVIACLTRFIGLETSPPGFFLDESAHATNAICIMETGRDASGVSMPLFAKSIGDFTPPTLLYTEALWARFFGTSIASFRSIAAVFNVLTIFGLFLLARSFFGTEAGLFAALAGAISPWSFQFSRIAWDPALAPCFLVFGVYFFFKSDKLIDALVSGIALSLAIYSYAPERAQVPLLLLVMIPVRKALLGLNIKWLAVIAITMAVTLAPLAYGVLFGSLQVRFSALSVFNATSSYAAALGLFALNFLRYFSLTFLFLSGDDNLRHSSGFAGQWDWLDIFVVLSGLFMWWWSALDGKARVRIRCFKILVLFSLAGYAFGIVPAAFTNEGIPHALRAIGCWPFLALLVGLILWRLQRFKRGFIPAALAVSVIFFGLYCWDYFTDYPKRAGPSFNVEVKNYAEVTRRTGNWDQFKKAFPPRLDPSRRYFSLAYGGQTCDTSR